MKAADSAPQLVYCWPGMFFEQPGLGHMKELARTLFREAHLYGGVALLPPLLSNPGHNFGRRDRLHWDDYFDFTPLPVRFAELRTRADLRAVLHRHEVRFLKGPCKLPPPGALLCRYLDSPDFFGDWLPTALDSTPSALLEPDFSNRFPDTIRTLAAHVLDELGPLEGVLHIRRGDLASPETNPDAVIEHLRAHGANRGTVFFILTNETSADYHQLIRQAFPLARFEHEVATFRDGPCARDNYLRFRVGKCLQEGYDRLGLGTLRHLRPIANLPPRSPVARLVARFRHWRQGISLPWLQAQAGQALP